MKVLSLLVFTLLFPFYVLAQVDEEEASDRLVIIEAGASISSPVGPFKRNVDHRLYGFEGGVYFQLNEDQPFVIGFDGFYNFMDSYSVFFFDNIDGQDIELEEKTSTHLTALLASLRYYPDLPFGIVKPYMQVAMGAKVLFTQTYLTDAGDEDIISEYDINEIGASLTYGASIGVNIQLGSLVFLNGRISYLPGNSIAYYREVPSSEIPQSNFALDAFKRVHSTTPMIRYSIGVSFFL